MGVLIVLFAIILAREHYDQGFGDSGSMTYEHSTGLELVYKVGAYLSPVGLREVWKPAEAVLSEAQAADDGAGQTAVVLLRC